MGAACFVQVCARIQGVCNCAMKLLIARLELRTEHSCVLLIGPSRSGPINIKNCSESRLDGLPLFSKSTIQVNVHVRTCLTSRLTMVSTFTSSGLKSLFAQSCLALEFKWTAPPPGQYKIDVGAAWCDSSLSAGDKRLQWPHFGCI